MDGDNHLLKANTHCGPETGYLSTAWKDSQRKMGSHTAHCLPFLLGRYHWQSSAGMCQLCCCCLRQGFPLQAMLASNPWWSFCLSFSEHHILLMPWLYERAVTLAHPSMPGMVLSDLWSPECGHRWTQSITVFQHDSVVRDIYSQLKPCSKFWIMNAHPTSKRQSLTVRQCWVPTEVSSWSCHFRKEQPWLYTANCTGKVAYLPRSVIKCIFCSYFQVIMGLFGNILRNIFLCMHVVVIKTN